MPSPNVTDIGARSISLNWDEPPPELQSDPPRQITYYAVTATPQDGGDPVTVYVPATPGEDHEIPGLNPETPYDINIAAVVETEGQDEPGIYDFGLAPMAIETSKLLLCLLLSIFQSDRSVA